MKTRDLPMEDGGGHSRSFLECGAPPPLLNTRGQSAVPQSARGLAHSKTWRSSFALLGFILLHSAICLRVQGQSYTIDWYKIAGGGGTGTGGTYQVSGTIGQPEASGAMVGGQYSVTGGYWSMINVVQSPGVPKLTIVPNGPNSVKLFWLDPATNTYTLQQNANLGTATWATSGYLITNGFGTNFCTITPSTGNWFFRLKQQANSSASKDIGE